MPHLRGALAGLLVVAILGAALWWFFGRDGARSPLPPPPSSLLPPPSSLVPTNVPVRAAAPVKKKPASFWDRPTTNGLTPVQARIWRYRRNPPSYTNTTSLTQPKSRYAIFPSGVENELACLMTLRPGETLVGTPVYDNAKMTEAFLKSCETPILESPDDTPYQRQLKKDMIALKIELRERLANGEELATILLDARRENERLAQIRRAVVGDVREMIRSDAKSEADVDTLVEAANRMLDEKGIAPMKVNPFTRRQFMNMVKRNAAEAGSK